MADTDTGRQSTAQILSTGPMVAHVDSSFAINKSASMRERASAPPVPTVLYEAPNTVRIAFVTLGDCRDVDFWSGTPYHMFHALKGTGYEVVPIGPLHPPSLFVSKVFSKARKVFGLRSHSPFHTEAAAKHFGRDAQHKIDQASPDVVFAPAGSMFASEISRRYPLVYTSDATFKLVENYHPNYSNLSSSSRRTADELERAAITRADLALYPTRWAARSAINDYGADASKVHIIPWGANLVETPELPTSQPVNPMEGLKLLFIGRDWEGKGAQTAVDTTELLRQNGIPASLTICGCTPPSKIEKDWLTAIPFLNKTDPQDLERIKSLYIDADLFILPTRADCYGIVFNEAAAHGVPSIAPATGGVDGAVVDGETGLLVSERAGAAEYANKIIETLETKDALADLKASARRAYVERLNWNHWAAQTTRLMAAL